MQQAMGTVKMISRCAAGIVMGSVLLALGCHHPVVGRPAIVGASASSGVGAGLPPSDSELPSIPSSVDLEATSATVVLARHRRPLNFATGLHFRDPTESTRRQLDRAMATNPSCLVAIDLLFWSAHMPVDPKLLGTDEEARQRLASLEEVLGQLDAIRIPIVLGYVPPIDPERIEFVEFERVPSRELLAELNGRIETWASERPNVVMVDFGGFVESVYAETPSEIAGNVFDGEAMRGLIQEDNLHPTAKGLVVLMQLACAELEARGLIDADDWQSNSELAMIELPEKAALVASRGFGAFGLLDLMRARDRMVKAVEDQDCEEASRLLDEMLELFASLQEEPEAWDMISFSYSLLFWGGGCREEVAKAQVRQIDRLTPEIAAERPNPWKFTLWEDSMRKLGWVDGVLERLIDMREARGGYPEPYDDFATAYLLRETAWEQYRDLVIDLYPRDEIVDRITARSANRFAGGDDPLGDGPLRIPLTPQGYEDLVDSWKIHQAFNREDTTPKPTMDGMEWTKNARSASNLLRSRIRLAVQMAKAGELELARELVRRSEQQVGRRFYEEWQAETRLARYDRTWPVHSAECDAPTMAELDTWNPVADKAAVVDEAE